jgi:hypothetical protein
LFGKPRDTAVSGAYHGVSWSNVLALNKDAYIFLYTIP